MKCRFIPGQITLPARWIMSESGLMLSCRRRFLPMTWDEMTGAVELLKGSLQRDSKWEKSQEIEKSFRFPWTSFLALGIVVILDPGQSWTVPLTPLAFHLIEIPQCHEFSVQWSCSSDHFSSEDRTMIAGQPHSSAPLATVSEQQQQTWSGRSRPAVRLRLQRMQLSRVSREAAVVARRVAKSRSGCRAMINRRCRSVLHFLFHDKLGIVIN